MSDADSGFIQRASAYSSDRWLYAWAPGYAAIGAASRLVPLYALALGAGPFVVGALVLLSLGLLLSIRFTFERTGASRALVPNGDRRDG